MNTALDPRVSEFETDEHAASHDRWFRAKVQQAMDDSRPGVPHDQVMAEMWAVIDQYAPKKNEA
jgi:hypothetical protein